MNIITYTHIYVHKFTVPFWLKVSCEVNLDFFIFRLFNSFVVLFVARLVDTATCPRGAAGACSFGRVLNVDLDLPQTKE